MQRRIECVDSSQLSTTLNWPSRAHDRETVAADRGSDEGGEPAAGPLQDSRTDTFLKYLGGAQFRFQKLVLQV